MFRDEKFIFVIVNQKYMDKNTLEFVTYCIGSLSRILHLPQREVYNKLKQSDILYGYIVSSYDVLHTFGSRYLMEDLIDFMKEKGVLKLWNYTMHQLLS